MWFGNGASIIRHRMGSFEANDATEHRKGRRNRKAALTLYTI